MNRLKITVLVIAALIFFVAGCNQAPEDVSLTIESQVASSVNSTIEALPSATTANTQTPYPSLTPLATYTPYPTLTPQPTFTPPATYTPYPTLSPTPENTATAVPTTAPRIQATTAVPTAALPTAVPVNNLPLLKAEIASTMADLSHYQSTLFRGIGTRILPVNCQEIVAAYDRIVSIIPLNVSADDPVIQNAYTVYQTAANQFAELTTAWTDGCRESLANGVVEKTIDDAQRGNLVQGIDEIKRMLSPVNDQLSLLGG